MSTPPLRPFFILQLPDKVKQLRSDREVLHLIAAVVVDSAKIYGCFALVHIVHIAFYFVVDSGGQQRLAYHDLDIRCQRSNLASRIGLYRYADLRRCDACLYDSVFSRKLTLIVALSVNSYLKGGTCGNDIILLYRIAFLSGYGCAMIGDCCFFRITILEGVVVILLRRQFPAVIFINRSLRLIGIRLVLIDHIIDHCICIFNIMRGDLEVNLSRAGIAALAGEQDRCRSDLRMMIIHQDIIPLFLQNGRFLFQKTFPAFPTQDALPLQQLPQELPEENPPLSKSSPAPSLSRKPQR